MQALTRADSFARRDSEVIDVPVIKQVTVPTTQTIEKIVEASSSGFWQSFPRVRLFMRTSKVVVVRSLSAAQGEHHSFACYPCCVQVPFIQTVEKIVEIPIV